MKKEKTNYENLIWVFILTAIIISLFGFIKRNLLTDFETTNMSGYEATCNHNGNEMKFKVLSTSNHTSKGNSTKVMNIGNIIK